jgi:hypothetical protein
MSDFEPDGWQRLDIYNPAFCVNDTLMVFEMKIKVKEYHEQENL